MKREKIKLTEEELKLFDFTAGYIGAKWEVQGEIYYYTETIRTDVSSDGESWDTIVQRESDNKFFKWNCWDAGSHNGYIMSDRDEYQIQEVFPEVISKTVYK